MGTRDKNNACDKEIARQIYTNLHWDSSPNRRRTVISLATGRNRSFITLLLAFMILSLTAITGLAQTPVTAEEAWGPNYNEQAPVPSLSKYLIQSVGTDTRARLLHWNSIAIDATGLDHTPVAPGESRVFGEQLGPGRSSRAMAIIHIAMFEAINAITGGFRSYIGLARVSEPRTHSIDAAIAQAAHDTLVAMYPSQRQSFNTLLADDLAELPNNVQKSRGIAIGQRAATIILGRRTNDGSQIPEPRIGVDYFPGNAPGVWRQDPISRIPLALGARWNQVKGFVMQSASQFRIPPPPEMTSERYTRAFNEVKRLGGDGINTSTERSADQSFAGVFWAYDGVPSLCAPPRLYNQVTVQVANQVGTRDVIELARLLALVNTAMADAGVAAWESKYFYKFWRPIGGVREASPGTGPTGAGDGNPATIGDPTFMPLGAPASNLNGPNFTPPFPAYPSGHATFGGALFQTLRNFYGRDNIAFTFVSDEYNGVTRDNRGVVRPLIPRTFRNFTQAEEENGQSRIYLGIHWEFDKTEGVTQGRNIANLVFRNAFTPVN